MKRFEKPIAFRLSSQDATKLKEIAEDNFCSVSTYCRDIIREHIDKEES